ncbi:MAG: hypothetical protein HFACDABA_03239 [Anaerolineales bacterium]|nr:hypothetical protein [Anaerolineales bacterium]
MGKTFGETRYFIGDLKTDYTFTGQREEASLGLYFFVARWLDPSLGRFTSPDTIVPTSTQGTQAWDRYAFVNNNPVRYTDPTGHMIVSDGSQSNPGDPCMRYGYDTPQCRMSLNLPEHQKDDDITDEPRDLGNILPKDDDATKDPTLPSPPSSGTPPCKDADACEFDIALLVYLLAANIFTDLIIVLITVELLSGPIGWIALAATIIILIVAYPIFKETFSTIEHIMEYNEWKNYYEAVP